MNLNMSEKQDAMVHLLTFIRNILFCSLSVQRWSGLKIKIALVREVLITEPHRFKARTKERGKSGNRQLITRTPIIPSSFPRRNSGDFRETGFIAGSRSIRHQSSKSSRVFLKDVMELRHESITLSFLVRQALNATCSILICFSCKGGDVLAPGFLRQTHFLFTAASSVS